MSHYRTIWSWRSEFAGAAAVEESKARTPRRRYAGGTAGPPFAHHAPTTAPTGPITARITDPITAPDITAITDRPACPVRAASIAPRAGTLGSLTATARPDAVRTITS